MTRAALALVAFGAGGYALHRHDWLAFGIALFCGLVYSAMFLGERAVSRAHRDRLRRVPEPFRPTRGWRNGR